MTGTGKRARGLTAVGHEIKKNKMLFLMLTPALLYLIVFRYIPLVGSVLAFKEFSYSGGIFGSPWNGLKNFRLLFAGGKVGPVMLNTVLYNFTWLFFNMFLQVAIAIFVSMMVGKLYKRTCQSVMLLPHFISYVVVGTFAYNILNYETGLLNNLLKSIGMEPFDAYGRGAVWPYILTITQAWKGVGYGSIIYLAAIAGIDKTYYEAADIDGASTTQKIMRVTLPTVKPIMVIMGLLGIGGIFRGQFELFYQLTGDNALLFKYTDVIDTYIFRSVIRSASFNITAAMGLMQSMLGFITVLIANLLVRRVDSDNALF